MNDYSKTQNRKQAGGVIMIPPPMLASPVIPVERYSVATPSFMGPLTTPTVARFPQSDELYPVFPSPAVRYGKRMIMDPRFTVPYNSSFFFVRSLSKNDPYFILIVRYKINATDKVYAFFNLDKKSTIYTLFQCGGGYPTLQNNGTPVGMVVEPAVLKNNKREEVKEFFNNSIKGRAGMIQLTEPPELLGKSIWNIDVFVGEVDVSATGRPADTPEVKYLTVAEINNSSGAGIVVANQSKSFVKKIIQVKP